MNQLKDFFQWILDAIKIWVIIQPWEQGLLVRNGSTMKKLKGGIYFKIPYLDSVYVQETRLRVITLSMQTLTTKDGHTITINSSVGYVIEDLQKLYLTLYHPESTLTNIAMGEVAEFLYTHNKTEITPKDIENKVLEKLKADDYGLKFEYYKITNFAVVKTYRLIQDQQSWVDNSLKLDEKKK